MGVDFDFRKAYLKSQIAAGSTLPTAGKVFVSVKNADKRATTTLARRLVELGFTLVATAGTAHILQRQGMSVEITHKVGDDHHPNVLDLMKAGDIQLVFNTPEDGRAPWIRSRSATPRSPRTFPTTSPWTAPRPPSGRSRRCSRANSR
jgi:carbamoyl-phosphate synthase large subunit